MPLLEAIRDGKAHRTKEIKQVIADTLRLSSEELAERLPSGRQTIYDNRVGWARTYLKKAGLVTVPGRAQIQITEEGKRLLGSGVKITDDLLAEKYPDFAAFKSERKFAH